MTKSITFIILSFAVFFTGCTHKQQINPIDDGHVNLEEKKFAMEQKLNKKFEEGREFGKNEAYSEIKESLKPLASYMESIRISSLLYKNGGICLPPIMLDKTDKTAPSIIAGQAHLCDEFTVDRILELAKGQIPGMPEGYGKLPKNKDNNDVASFGIQEDVVNYSPAVLNSDKKPKLQKVVFIPSLSQNQKILQESGKMFNQIEFDSDKKRYKVQFNTLEDARNFCETNKICVGE